MTSRRGRVQLERLISVTDVPCEVRLPAGEVLRSCEGEPVLSVVYRCNEALRAGDNEFALGQAYLRGDIDIDGDMMALFELRTSMSRRDRLRDRLALFVKLFLGHPQMLNRQTIADHYELGDDFYLSFLDKRARFYSQCLFESDAESLEAAAERKLDTITKVLEIKPGMRLLDIGGGWGGISEHAAAIGADVTALTISPNSHDFMARRFRDLGLHVNVILEDFLNHEPSEPYDAIVILGVIEHIPNYRAFTKRAWKCLRPDGRIYIDASAMKIKYNISRFMRKYIWTGIASFMTLHDLLRELLFHGFQVESVRSESHDYHLTLIHWARRFDESEKEIVQRWGREVYRAFRIYLWSGAYNMAHDRTQAYRVIALRTQSPGPQPGALSRFAQFVRELA